jgi:hypothetical protein
MAKQTTDPALIAADEAETAEREFFLVPVRNFVDEMSTRYLQAEARWQDAESKFADAVLITAAGALKKLCAVEALLTSMVCGPDDIGVRHVRSLATYLARIAVETDGDDPAAATPARPYRPLNPEPASGRPRSR